MIAQKLAPGTVKGESDLSVFFFFATQSDADQTHRRERPIRGKSALRMFQVYDLRFSP